MSAWACQNCACAGVTIPHSYHRSPICDWCAEDLRRAGKKWCAHCRQGQPLSLWSSRNAKRCRTCTAGYDARRAAAPHRSRQLASYYANPDRTLYRIKLKQMAQRQSSRADQIFVSLRKRIALAEMVARTPGWSWTMRARRFGSSAQQLAADYRRQCAGDVRDADMADVARPKRGTP
jgi:hypothetical protein